MIEVTMTWELRPGIDLDAYAKFSKNAVGMALRAPGIVEFRAHRNMLSPRARATYVWQDLADWAKFHATAEWLALMPELNAYATNIRTQIWGPSPVMPESLRPE